MPNADAFVQRVLQKPWDRYSLVHAKDMVSLEHLPCWHSYVDTIAEGSYGGQESQLVDLHRCGFFAN